VERIRVAVVDEHEIFRRGIVSCLGEDGFLDVVCESTREAPEGEVDVAVVSADAAGAAAFPCPVVVCSDAPSAERVHPATVVAATLPRRLLPSEQLTVAVRAAAVGLQVNHTSAPTTWRRDERHVEVLRLLAEGAGTQDIAASLSYSERTIKTLIQEVERELGARSRAHAVAEGIRRGLI
jgi:DNA-binding NarL/FixJ family response regulator